MWDIKWWWKPELNREDVIEDTAEDKDDDDDYDDDDDDEDEDDDDDDNEEDAEDSCHHCENEHWISLNVPRNGRPKHALGVSTLW